VLKLVPGIGKTGASRIWEQISSAPDPFEAIERPGLKVGRRAANSWRDFIRVLAEIRDPSAIDRPGVQIGIVLSGGYEEYLRHTYANAEARAEDLRQLANYASRFDSTESFLSELALMNTERFGPPRGLTGEDVVEGSEEDEKLTLSSIHQAKGLEWRVVFLIWAAEGKFPSSRSLRDPDAEEEERRLFYVTITRAQDELYVCYPLLAPALSRQTVIQRPSRFILEVPPELFEVWSVDEEEEAPQHTGSNLIN
jgi:DNA helicase-2/ATP-dependent DNA helicase PcrA